MTRAGEDPVKTGKINKTCLTDRF